MKTKKTAKRKYTKRALPNHPVDASLHMLLTEHYRQSKTIANLDSHLGRISALIDSRMPLA